MADPNPPPTAPDPPSTVPVTAPASRGLGPSPTYDPAAGGASGPRAGFWQRFGAYLLDAILVGVVTILVAVVIGILFAALKGAALKGAGYAIVLLGIAYFIYFEGGPTGQTLGKRALGIRVIDFETGGPIGYGRAFIRYIGRILSGIFVLGYLWMLWDREKQTWHDKFANDVVVPVAAYPLAR